jgi:hypothetical protein
VTLDDHGGRLFASTPEVAETLVADRVLTRFAASFGKPGEAA